MISYKDLKQKLIDNKSKVTLTACFIIIFIIGFGTGKADKTLDSRTSKTKAQSNYTTKAQEKPVKVVTGAQQNEAKVDDLPVPGKLPDNSDKAKPVSGSCKIKGNISANSKIYHTKGGAFYEKVKPEQCFNTEAEAKAAGFRKSSR